MRTLIAIIVAAAVAAGCSSHKTQTTEGGATVTTDSANQTVTVRGQGGSVTVGKGAAADVASVGLPVYPGASTAEGGSYSATSSEGTGTLVVMTTTDGFDKVYAWYKSRMPNGSEKMKMSAGGTSEAMFQIGADTDKAKKGVVIASGEGKTTITLTSGTKN